MARRDSAHAFIASQRQTLERLESFVGTSAYDSLLKTLRSLTDGDQEVWLLQWLIEHDVILGGMPLELVDGSGGLELLTKRIAQMGGGMCA